MSIQKGLLLLGSIVTIIAASLISTSSRADTPITDQYGRGTTSSSDATWLETINQTYQLSVTTPVTDQHQGLSQSDLSSWAEAVREQYNVGQYSAPVTDQYGAASSSADLNLWRETMKEQYGL